MKTKSTEVANISETIIKGQRNNIVQRSPFFLKMRLSDQQTSFHHLSIDQMWGVPVQSLRGFSPEYSVLPYANKRTLHVKTYQESMSQLQGVHISDVTHALQWCYRGKKTAEQSLHSTFSLFVVKCSHTSESFCLICFSITPTPPPPFHWFHQRTIVVLLDAHLCQSDCVHTASRRT